MLFKWLKVFVSNWLHFHLYRCCFQLAFQVFNNCMQRVSNLAWTTIAFICLSIRGNRLNQSPRICHPTPQTYFIRETWVHLGAAWVVSAGSLKLIISLYFLQRYYTRLHLEILEPFLQGSFLHFIKQQVLLAKGFTKNSSSKNNFSSISWLWGVTHTWTFHIKR